MYVPTTVRQSEATMTNISTSATTNTMMTLDKMWKKAAVSNKDATMEDMQEKESKKTTNHNPQSNGNKKNANSNDADKTIEEYSNPKAINIWSKFRANDQAEAIKQHQRIVSILKTELTMSQIINSDSQTTDTVTFYVWYSRKYKYFWI